MFLCVLFFSSLFFLLSLLSFSLSYLHFLLGCSALIDFFVLFYVLFHFPLLSLLIFNIVASSFSLQIITVLFLHACIFRSNELSWFAAHKRIWILGSKVGWFVNSQKKNFFCLHE